MAYSIYIVSPPGYPHSQSFTEVAEGLKEGFAELGFVAPIVTTTEQITGRAVILGANLIPSFNLHVPDDAILFNLEQASSAWFTDAYTNLLRRHEVWDYSTQNIELLRQKGVTAKFCPIGYEPCLTRIAPREEDYDVLFYGSVFGRRTEILRRFQEAGVVVNVLFGCYGSERDAWIARSKIILNLHAYENAPLERVRLSYLWANKKFIISEQSIDQGLGQDAVYTPTEQLPAMCYQYLQDPVGRSIVAQRGFDQFSQTRQSEYLKWVL